MPTDLAFRASFLINYFVITKSVNETVFLKKLSQPIKITAPFKKCDPVIGEASRHRKDTDIKVDTLTASVVSEKSIVE